MSGTATAPPTREKPTTVPKPKGVAKPEERTNFRPEPEKDESFTARAGDWVFWYINGDKGASPVPAMVTKDGDIQRALSLEVHNHGYVSYVNAAKHMHDNATEIDRERNGGWTWNRGVRPPAPTEGK